MENINYYLNINNKFDLLFTYYYKMINKFTILKIVCIK